MGSDLFLVLMGKRAQDRLRTIWTPEMDRFFIDLMLDQVGKGNRFDDHLFSKRAWKQMSILFNSRFKFQYDKDVLKNRHKTLRNLYRAVRKILDNDGFDFDEMRQMVTAENNRWDEYIQANPDARSYRIKTIPYYSDLCLIYESKEESAERVPQSSEDLVENKITITDQPRCVSEGSIRTPNEARLDEDCMTPFNGVADSPNLIGATTTRSRTYWQPPMDRYFIDIMLDQIGKGNQVDGVFHKQVWVEMTASFNDKFGLNYEVDILKNRYKTLRRQHNAIKNLLKVDGFIWDDSRQMVTADDCIWQDYIKTHSDVRQFMTRPVPYYKDLCMICGDSTSIGESNGVSIQNIDMQHILQYDNIYEPLKSSTSPATTDYSEDESYEGMELSYGDLKADTTTNQKTKNQSENCLPTPKRSRPNEEEITSALGEMVNAIYSFSAKKNDVGNSCMVSIESVIKAVQALPDMEEELVLDACDFLEDEAKARTFMALDFKLRKKWLLRKLRSSM